MSTLVRVRSSKEGRALEISVMWLYSLEMVELRNPACLFIRRLAISLALGGTENFRVSCIGDEPEVNA